MTDKTQATAHACIKPQCDPAKCSDCVCAITPSDGAGQVVLGLLNAFAVNDLGHPFEDGDSAAVDRARQWLQNRSTALQAAPPAPAAVAVPDERTALARLESACDRRAKLTTPEAYKTIASCKGMYAALDELDEARTQARAALASAPALASDTESVLIDGIAYEVPAAVAGELLSLHLDLLAAAPAQAVAMPDETTPDYGSMELGWSTFPPLAADEKRLMALITNLFGNDHQAFNDLDALVNRARLAPATPAQEHATQLAGQASTRRQWTDGTRTLKQDVLGAIHDYSRTKPEDDPEDPESWESWFEAAFDLLGTRVGDIFEEHTASDQAQGCTRSHPHENMSPMCVLRTEIARLHHAAANAQAQEVARDHTAVLCDLLNRRPAMNSGLDAEYAAWSDECYRVMGALSQAAANDDGAQEDARDLEAEALRACRDLPEGWEIVIHLEKGYGGVVLIDPEDNENDLPVDGMLFDALKESIDQAVQADAARATQGGAA